MATLIDDSGAYDYDAPIGGTETTDWITDAPNKTLKFVTDTGVADTDFTLPPSTPWLLIETYDVEDNEGWVGYTKWQSDVGDIKTDIDAARALVDAEYTLYKMKATWFDGTSTAKVYEADETGGFPAEASPTYTVTSYSPSTATWKISNALTAPNDKEFNTDPFEDSSLILRHLFNDDATALVGNDATLVGTGTYTTAVYNEGYTVATASQSNYMDLDVTIPSGAFSISCFVDLQANTVHGGSVSDRNGIFGAGEEVIGEHIKLSIRDDGSFLCQIGNDDTNTLLSISDAGDMPIDDSSFHHFVLTYGGSGTTSDTKINFYSDGSLVSKSNGGSGTYSDAAKSTCRIGSAVWNTALLYTTLKGTIDQFDIYDKELSLSEVQELGFA